jgi:hypothetical protein
MMKLNKEQCSNLPFPVGCRVWYNMKLDVFHKVSTRSVANGAKLTESELQGQDVGQKWGALLSTSNSDQHHAAAAGGHSYEAFVFDRGVVSAVYLDIINSNIMYEIKQLDVDGGEIVSSGTSVAVLMLRTMLVIITVFFSD